MTAPAAQDVASVHWLNWLDQPAVIAFGTLIIAGQITRIWHDSNTGVFDFVIGGKEFRACASDMITIATPAQAAPVLYGAPLGS